MTFTKKGFRPNLREHQFSIILQGLIIRKVYILNPLSIVHDYWKTSHNLLGSGCPVYSSQQDSHQVKSREAYADDIKDPTIKPNNTASASEGFSFPSIQKQCCLCSSLAINSLLDFKSSALRFSHIFTLNAAISGPENRAVPCPYSVVIVFLYASRPMTIRIGQGTDQREWSRMV